MQRDFFVAPDIEGQTSDLDGLDHSTLRSGITLDVSLRDPKLTVLGELLSVPERATDR